MRPNGMCPICYLRRLFLPAKPFVDTCHLPPIDNGAPRTPIMGWSSWNTFRNRIDADLILDTADAMLRTGLYEAGYRYVNLDDNWHSSLRDAEGRIVADPAKFPQGMAALIDALNAKGFKAGLYSSNGTLTCEDLPASLHREGLDARTFAGYGVEYLKYDYCHHEIISRYAPLVYGVELSREGMAPVFYDCAEATLSGMARRMHDAKVPTGVHVAGLDRNQGAMRYEIEAPEAGQYTLTICVRKRGSRYRKALAAIINDVDVVLYDVPPQKHFNYTARFQQRVTLAAGRNEIRLFNPIARTSDSAFLQYYLMGKELAAAAREREGDFRPIVYSICEWGWNKPHLWGALAGNMWRTTPDIRPIFPWIKWIYGHNVKLYRYAHAGAFNDPDMLEVGNGRLTHNQNVAHFSLWCMMSAPLVLGNDLRHITQDVLRIVTNRHMIAIDQDPLCRPAKRMRRGTVDVLARPLADGSVAVCLFNRAHSTKRVRVDLDAIFRDPYVDVAVPASYTLHDVWQDNEFTSSSRLETTVDAEGVNVYLVRG